VQRKLLAVKAARANLYQPAAAEGPAPYIAKLNPQGDRAGYDTVRNEALSLCWISKVLGADEVTEFELGRIEELNEQALVVKRFDRTADNQKLRLEDFAQILNKPRGRDYQGKYEASYEEAASVITDYSVRPQIDLDRFFRRIVAFVLVGNCDAHLKNFSLLETEQGLRLSPVYDVVNTTLYPDLDSEFGLSFDGTLYKISDVTPVILRQFGLRIGLNEVSIDAAFDKIKKAALRADKVLPEDGHDPASFGSRFTQSVRDACHRILET